MRRVLRWKFRWAQKVVGLIHNRLCAAENLSKQFSQIDFLLSYPLESMMESTEATESMTSLYDNIGKTTVVSTLDSCKGSKLREVENSCSSVDLRSTFHRCRKSQGEPGKEIGRRLEGNTNYCCSNNMSDLGRVAELGSLSSGAKMAMKIFVKCVFTIFASNASFLRVIANLQN